MLFDLENFVTSCENLSPYIILLNLHVTPFLPPSPPPLKYICPPPPNPRNQKATWPSGYGAGFRNFLLERLLLLSFLELTCSKERGFESLSCQLYDFFLDWWVRLKSRVACETSSMSRFVIRDTSVFKSSFLEDFFGFRFRSHHLFFLYVWFSVTFHIQERLRLCVHLELWIDVNLFIHMLRRNARKCRFSSVLGT